jgi:DNA-binding Xre family transcriptional regulator
VDVIRIRLPELLNEEIPTAYAIAKASVDRISLSAAHRLVRARGAVRRYDADVLEALCEMFDIGPGELLEISRDGKRKRGRA